MSFWGLEWKVYEISEKTFENRDLFELNINNPIPGTEEVAHLEWNPQKPLISEDCQIKIEPK